MGNILDKAKSPQDLRQISPQKLPQLAEEIRHFILDVVATKAGHLGSSLGVVELSIALHYYFDTPHDLLIWDVGHQSYGHKLLTGRADDFQFLRQLGGMSGFPSRDESEYDAFGTGHSSTAISAITGMALADKIKHIHRHRIAVIGDASIVSGMAMEGLNHLGDTDLNVTVILNDNNIGIDPSVGALKHHFNQLQNQPSSEFFSALGFHYHGIIDGHDPHALLHSFEQLEKIHRPKLLHIKTTKGKGYQQAEKDQILWHAPGKFDKVSGRIIPKSKSKKSYQEVVGETLSQLFESDDSLVAITPAMLTGSGLSSLKIKFPERVWDVGIAEQHAVTLAAGLATQNITPYCVIYSTFLQRAWDQVIHDVALQKLPVVFCIDRAGIVGQDGATHHGYFDIAFFNQVPNTIVSAPLDNNELKQLLSLAANTQQAFAIRYPKGECETDHIHSYPLEVGKAYCLKEGTQKAIVSTGTIGQKLFKIIGNSKFAWFHFPFIKPLDTKMIAHICSHFEEIHTFEEGIATGGFGQSFMKSALEHNDSGTVSIHAYPDDFIPHGKIKDLEKYIGWDSDSIQRILFN